MKVRKLHKAGHSYCLTIPPEYVRNLGLKSGDDMILTFDRGQIHIEPLLIFTARIKRAGIHVVTPSSEFEEGDTPA